MPPINRVELAYAITRHSNRVETAALLVRGWTLAGTPTADRLLYERQQLPRTWLQRRLAGR